MEHVINNLLKDFERGKMSRRQLIQSLAMAATAAAAAGGRPLSAAADEGKGFEAIAVNHISYQVKDYTEDARLLHQPARHEGRPGQRQAVLPHIRRSRHLAPAAERTRRERGAESGSHRVHDQELGPEES